MGLDGGGCKDHSDVKHAGSSYTKSKSAKSVDVAVITKAFN
eukprot:COSAG02_NODE_275_length_26232_cov_85.210424_3_plen_41_part_00